MKAKDPVVLVFGEGDNDTGALIELAGALRPRAPRFVARRAPLILMKGRDAGRIRDNASRVAAVVRATKVRHDVRGVIAHQDCDAVEPADAALAERIRTELELAGVPSPVPATPAWELEAWFYLWPDVAQKVCASWRRPSRAGKEVGRIENAKEAFRRDLRPAGKGGARDYEESDAPKLARWVRELGLVDRRDARSASFDRFASAVRAADW